VSSGWPAGSARVDNVLRGGPSPDVPQPVVRTAATAWDGGETAGSQTGCGEKHRRGTILQPAWSSTARRGRSSTASRTASPATGYPLSTAQGPVRHALRPFAQFEADAAAGTLHPIILHRAVPDPGAHGGGGTTTPPGAARPGPRHRGSRLNPPPLILGGEAFLARLQRLPGNASPAGPTSGTHLLIAGTKTGGTST